MGSRSCAGPSVLTGVPSEKFDVSLMTELILRHLLVWLMETLLQSNVEEALFFCRGPDISQTCRRLKISLVIKEKSSCFTKKQADVYEVFSFHGSLWFSPYQSEWAVH